jgi:hypothetical protein
VTNLELLNELQARRLRLHRLEPSRPLRNVRAAVAFVRERQIVVAAGRSSLPMLAEALVGHEIHGSWMADPEVFRIHRLMRRLSQSPAVIVATLIQGKETLIDASLGPSVARIANDRSRREAAYHNLPPLARALLDDVQRSGEIRMDRWKASAKLGRDARVRLERQLLVVSTSLHTESGYHTALVRPWAASPAGVRFGKASRRLDYAEAQRRLWLAAVRSAVVAPEREARQWFPFAASGLEDLIDAGKCQRISAAGRTWLTCRQ